MRRILACVLACAVLSVPLAQAGSEPAIYYLERPDASSLLDGERMSIEAPEDDAPVVRPVTLGTAELPSLFFTAAEADHPDWLLGPSFVAMWRGQEAVTDGNITATLYEVHQNGTQTVIASDSLRVNISEDPDSIPDPQDLVPSDPTDPEGTVLETAAKAMPLVLEPMFVFNLGFLNHQLSEGSTIGLGIYLEADHEGNVPGGTIPLQYDGTLAPSYLYTPWYVPKVQADDDQQDKDSGSTGDDAGGSGSSGQGGASDDDPTPGTEPADEESPGVGLMALLALVGAAAYVARRRR